MASQRDIKRRIKSIKSTAQITKAMQMVAAARMRQAQRRVEESRPYSEHIRAIVADVAGTAGADVHPLLAQRDVRNVELLHITPDRGLAGGLPTNVNREAQRLVQETSEPVRVVSVGRKGRALARRLRWNMVEEFTDMGDRPGPEDVHPIAQRVLEDYTSGEVDRVYMVYTEFVSTMRQNAKRVQLLPVVPPEAEGDEGTSDGDEGATGGNGMSGNWDYEPDNPERVLSALLPRYVEFSIYHALLESSASFQSAQMIAMSAATDAANDLVKDLSLEANKARQAEITKEIAEISGAAEAIRGASG
ncbi:MAG: ATP synthase F1 subunit gamma [Chloroflexota bacterium]